MHRHPIMAATIVAVACLASLTVLAVCHLVDPGTVVGLISTSAVTVVGGVLYGKVEIIQQQSNGNLSRLLSIVERWGDQLAASQPPLPPLPPAGPPTPRVPGDGS